MNQQKRTEPLSFAGILKLLYSNRKSGHLKVQSAEGELVLHFQEGKIVNVEMPKGQEWIIGQYLIQGEVISERRLVRALKISTQKGLTPEQVLVDKRYISPDVLKRYMDLYSREVILPLFGKVGLVCSFTAEEPVENKWLPAVSVPYLLKEGERRAREWPLLNQRIASAEVVYGKDKSFISQVVKEGDETGNPLFSDKLDPEVGANERIIYYFVDGTKNIKQLARASGLDLFSSFRALFTLENKFMVKVLAEQGEESRRDRSLLVPLLVKGAFYLIIFAALAGLAFLRPGLLQVATGEREVDVQQLTQARAMARFRTAEAAVSARYLEKLTCPTSLDELKEKGLLAMDPDEHYHYHCDAQRGFALEPSGDGHGH
jgi:hypothetical protein